MSLCLGFILGLGLCLVKLYARKAVAGLADAYIQVIRGTPLLVQLYFFYFGLPSLGLDISAVTSGLVGLSMNSAAYVAEIMRAGFESVPRGQGHAAASLGLGPAQTLWHILFPQALRNSIPALSNEFITLVKSSSLLAMLAVLEITHAAQIVRSLTYASFECFAVVALIYLALTASLAQGLGWLERRSRISG